MSIAAVSRAAAELAAFSASGAVNRVAARIAGPAAQALRSAIFPAQKALGACQVGGTSLPAAGSIYRGTPFAEPISPPRVARC